MKILGLSFSKISGEKKEEFQSSDINTNIQFIDLKKEDSSLIKDSESFKLKYSFSIDYFSNKDTQSKKKNNEKKASLVFEGNIFIATSGDESKELLKQWKKKQIASIAKLSLYNYILRKCSIKAVPLQEELNLPTHVRLPQLQQTDNSVNSIN